MTRWAVIIQGKLLAWVKYLVSAVRVSKSDRCPKPLAPQGKDNESPGDNNNASNLHKEAAPRNHQVVVRQFLRLPIHEGWLCRS